MNIVKWVIENYGDISSIALGLLAVAEIIVRLTPTKKDDGAVERLGSLIRRLFDAVGMPNVSK